MIPILARAALPDSSRSSAFGAKLRIDSRRIDDVVAVHAATARGENRREIEMRDAEPREVVDTIARQREREPRVQLQSIRRRELRTAHRSRGARIR